MDEGFAIVEVFVGEGVSVIWGISVAFHAAVLLGIGVDVILSVVETAQPLRERATRRNRIGFTQIGK